MLFSLRFVLPFFSLVVSFSLQGQASSTPICDCIAQLEQELDSKEIKEISCLKQLIARIEDPIFLIDDLDNVDSSMVYSQCKSRHLTYGEVAFIIMEHIEPIPYSMALGIQNCTHAHCADNANLIEYFYTYWDTYTYDYLFGKYFEYLHSEERKEFVSDMKERW